MNSEKEQWFVLVVSEGGHLIPTPEEAAAKNTKYLDENGVIQDLRQAAIIQKQEVKSLDNFEEKIMRLLENRNEILLEYARLVDRQDTPEDIDGLTVRAVDYGRPAIQAQHSGEAAQNQMINLIDQNRIAREQKRQREDLQEVLNAARERVEEVNLLDDLIKRLPYDERSILEDTYRFSFDRAFLVKLWGPRYTKKKKVAIKVLADKYRCDGRRFKP